VQKTFRATALFFAWLLTAPAGAFDDSAVTPFSYPSWFKQSFYDLRDDLAEARTGGKRGIALLFSTQGCAYCHRMLQTSFADPEFVGRLRARFDVIGLEMFSDNEITDWAGETLRLKRFAVREGAQFSPTLIFYDGDGRRLLRLVGYYPAERLSLALDYLDAPAHAVPGFRAWLALREAAQGDAARPVDPGSAQVFSPPPYQYDRSRFEAEQPLLVIFSARGCAACADFRRDVLADTQIREELRDFGVVHLDAGDAATPLVMPDGRLTTPAGWLERLGLAGLPALAWFDERGAVVLKTDALVLKGRFANALGYVKDRAYARGWTYQRYARTRNIERLTGQRAGR
jgi:thioredoxin-related protein